MIPATLRHCNFDHFDAEFQDWFNLLSIHIKIEYLCFISRTPFINATEKCKGQFVFGLIKAVGVNGSTVKVDTMLVID